jgi:hypothetical protein
MLVEIVVVMECEDNIRHGEVFVFHGGYMERDKISLYMGVILLLKYLHKELVFDQVRDDDKVIAQTSLFT